MQLDAFILFIFSYDDIKGTFGEGSHTKQEFEEKNVVFQEDIDYLKRIFKKAGVISCT
ncbi:MAG: hypothetical protein Kow0084_13990 [Pseudothermotoga elfii]